MYSTGQALNHAHRDLIVKAMGAFDGFSHVMELGCGAGANLFRIAQQFPCSHVTGIDISKTAIFEAGKLLRTAHCAYSFMRGDASAAENIDDLACDVLLTDAFLIYVDPDRFEKLADTMKRVAKLGILMCEWHSPNGPFKDGNWVHDYEKHFPGFWAWPITSETWPDQKWVQYGYLIGWQKGRTGLNSGV